MLLATTLRCSTSVDGNGMRLDDDEQPASKTSREAVATNTVRMGRQNTRAKPGTKACSLDMKRDQLRLRYGLASKSDSSSRMKLIFRVIEPLIWALSSNTTVWLEFRMYVG